LKAAPTGHLVRGSLSRQPAGRDLTRIDGSSVTLVAVAATRRSGRAELDQPAPDDGQQEHGRNTTCSVFSTCSSVSTIALAGRGMTSAVPC
jgi:hypothetical protein